MEAIDPESIAAANPTNFPSAIAWVGWDEAMEQFLSGLAHARQSPFVAFRDWAELSTRGGDVLLERIACLVMMMGESPDEAALDRLRVDDAFPSTIFIAYNSLPASVVAAAQAGALAVLEAAGGKAELRHAVEEGLARTRQSARRRALRREIAVRLAQLPAGDREVVAEFAAHHTAAEIARRLGQGQRTMEARQTRIFKALRVRTLAELAALMAAAGLLERAAKGGREPEGKS